MPHIHTDTNQHDMTVSAWILLRQDDQIKCLVHFHRKIEVLMQIGGHIELDETPWQTVAHEVEEESGFTLDQLAVLQHTRDIPATGAHVIHPAPFMLNTHNVGDDHFHSDLMYGFVTAEMPAQQLAEGESDDLRWVSLEELEQLSSDGQALKDVYTAYKFLVEHLDTYEQVPASRYSIEKPLAATVTYKRGRPGQA